jgi:hypothetical protein
MGSLFGISHIEFDIISAHQRQEIIFHKIN